VIRLSAFADEISPDIDEQIAVLLAEGIHHVELRGAWNTGVLDLGDSRIGRIRESFAAAGIDVVAVASPVGKAPADTPVDSILDRLHRAIAVAEALNCADIRVFSFYPPSAPVQPETGYRDEVMNRLRAMVDAAADAGMRLLHENDVGLYGATVAGCADILKALPGPSLGAVLDPANYLLIGECPYPDGYEAVRARLASVHVKDVAAGQIVAAGEGNARFPDLLLRLKEDGYDGAFALEPHLGSAGQFQGFSGPERFSYAAGRLKALLADLDWAWS